MRARAPLAAFVRALVAAPAARSQDAPPAADPADVATVDAIVDAFYAVVSGPAGAPRQWARDATLYLPGAVFVRAARGGSGVRSVTPADLARQSDAFLVGSGFVEREIHRVVHRFGRIAHVWSTDEWRTADGRTGRGINSLHLWHDGERWWITHATMDDEAPDRPIPPAYLPD